MEKPKIFIASSGRAKTLAQALQYLLGSEVAANVWDEAGRRNAGSTIIEMLLNAARENDFAIVILTKDDVSRKEQGAGEEAKEGPEARDNCVFEAGIFMAKLGRERCILLNGLDKKDRPSDFGGIIVHDFIEPPPEKLRDLAACSEAVRAPAFEIRKRVQSLKQATDRPLSADEILAREVLRPAGELIGKESVVVAAIQPQEVTHKPALQVRKNLDAGIDYVYFFEGSDNGALKTCQLLQNLLLASLLEGEKDPEDARVRERIIRDPATSTQMITDLKLICENQKVRIFFMPSKPKPSIRDPQCD